jgi:hypothetical protein
MYSEKLCDYTKMMDLNTVKDMRDIRQVSMELLAAKSWLSSE